MHEEHADEDTYCSTINLSGQIEVLQARYSGRAFAPHWHEGYAVGLIDTGVEKFEYAGTTHRAGKGDLVLLNAGEVHTGEASDERGFGFKMLYIPEHTFREVASSVIPLRESLHFSNPVRRDPIILSSLMAAHRAICEKAPTFEIESLMITAIADVLERAGSWKSPSLPAFASRPVLEVRSLLHDRAFEAVSLDDLATVANMSKFHLLRAFRSRFGVTPHRYQLQLKVFRAKELLLSQAPALVAARCGFADQSHLNRVFRAFVGTTPGRYAQQFRPIRTTRKPLD